MLAVTWKKIEPKKKLSSQPKTRYVSMSCLLVNKKVLCLKKNPQTAHEHCILCRVFCNFRNYY